MALLRLHLRRRSKPLLPRRFSSSSSSSSSPFPPRPDDPNAATPSPPDPPPIPTSTFAEIRDRIKSSTTPPRRIPTFPPRPYQHQHHRPPPTPPPADLDEIRRSLALFHTPNSSPPPSAPSFVDLVRNSSAPTPTPGPGPGPAKPNASAPFSEMLQRLRETRPDHGDGGRRLGWPSLLSQRQWQSPTPSSSLPESIFGREMKERLAKARDGAAPMLAYRRHYDPDTMGMRLRELRPTGGGKDGKEWFSLEELKGRLATLRENDEKARRRDPVSEHMRSAIQHIETEKEKKTAYMQGMSIFMNFGMKPTPSYMLKPPQEELLERYFHPDHMSAAEKMKLELQRVRDEFKMSEIDCGSARVQVAQLTTKIKHLSEALHKKDKHSRKGLLEMVQRRKKLLKYLRRTDWDSYCLVLSKLGLRDVPEYKPPDYKSKSSTKTKASKSKKKKKMKA